MPKKTEETGPKRKRPHLIVTMASDVTEEARRRATEGSRPISHVVEEALREAWGLPSEEERRLRAKIAAEGGASVAPPPGATRPFPPDEIEDDGHGNIAIRSTSGRILYARKSGP